jgi:hypothetical protein
VGLSNHYYQRTNLTAYLPGNGGLLAAVVMMAAGWTNGPKTRAPESPADGKRDVHSAPGESFQRASGSPPSSSPVWRIVTDHARKA